VTKRPRTEKREDERRWTEHRLCRALLGSVFRPRQWLQGGAFDLLLDAKVKVPVSLSLESYLA